MPDKKHQINVRLYIQFSDQLEDCTWTVILSSFLLNYKINDVNLLHPTCSLCVEDEDGTYINNTPYLVRNFIRIY